MAEETFEIAMAVGVQTALGVVNSTIAGLFGTRDSSDGFVLGDGESGDANSGIVIPNLVRVARDVADVSGSFTKNASAFQRVGVENLSITCQVKGNGEVQSGAPSPGDASILVATADADKFFGVDALLQAAGLVGANGGANAEYDYTPRIGTTSPSTRYVTIKLWVADMSFVLQDCICESTVLRFPPGETGLVTFNLKVGSHDPATQFADGITFPDIDYGSQASLSAPAVKEVGSVYDATKSWRDLTITIAQELEEIPDCNQTSGIRLSQTARTVTLDGIMSIDDSDSDFEYQNLVATSAPTADLSFTVGEPTDGDGDTHNAYIVECNNVELRDVKYNRQGTITVFEFSGARCTAPTAGAEFAFVYA